MQVRLGLNSWSTLVVSEMSKENKKNYVEITWYWFGCHFKRDVPSNSKFLDFYKFFMIFAFSLKKINVETFVSFKNDDFLQKWSKINFLPKKKHFSFKFVIIMIWEIFWCISLVCRTKNGDFENSSHNSQTRDPRQPRGCSLGDYATQQADQELK